MAVRRTSCQRRVSLNSSAPSPLFVLLCVVVLFGASGSKHQRAKRKWEPPKINITENITDFKPKRYLTTVVTDNEKFHRSVSYRLEGPGADKPPLQHFWVNEKNGKLYQMVNLDREKKSSYSMTMHAHAINGTSLEDDPLDIKIQVRDINDEVPRITSKSGKIKEGVPAGFVVMDIMAEDNDQPGTVNSQVNYQIESQSPERAFMIDSKTGRVTTTKSLDRENIESYNLMVKVFDNGQPSLSSTSKVLVNVEDVNDNMPVFLSTELEANIKENVNNIEVGRVKVTDMDSQGSDAWKASYQITNGNEAGHFKIETDPVTNEGVIYVIKAFDHEATQASSLRIVANNIASYVGSHSSAQNTKPLQFIYHIEDVDELPKFEQTLVTLNRSEGRTRDKTLTVLKAKAPSQDGSNTGLGPNHPMRYKVGHDPAGFMKIDPKTGKVELLKDLDRESPYVKDGAYKATFIAIDEVTKQSSTATVAINVKDTNDNKPYLVNRTMCICADTVSEVLVNAKDNDSGQNAGPFKFTLPNEMLKKWSMSYTPGNVGMLVHNNGPIPEGRHIVPITVQDNQGLPGNGNLTIKAIECQDNENVADCKTVTPIAGGLSAGGIAGILAGLLGLLLLALLLLLCCCKLGTAKKIPIIARYNQMREPPLSSGFSPDSSGKLSKVPGSAVPLLLGGAAGGAAAGFSGELKEATASNKGSGTAMGGGNYQEETKTIEESTHSYQHAGMGAAGSSATGGAGSSAKGGGGSSMGGGAGGQGFGMNHSEIKVMDEVTHAKPYGNMQFAAGNAGVQDRLYAPVEHQHYNFAEQMGTARSDATEYYVNESLRLLDSDLSVAAGDVRLVYTYEGSGNSVISLDCCDSDDNDFPHA
uniref:Cadherin domain-containing protein n=1 Tax=Eptatretus burgeri TaxID=7764 RepID=A0A8C4Q2Z6_EPTBU